MKVDQKILKKLEILSNIEIKPEKREETIENLSEIVNFVENLNELDLDDKDASFATLEGGTPFREDKPSQNKEVIEIILQNAPKQEDGFFVVPKIIE
jgi:aspartyl-tRNA(Asn)/glutamyl-tRNA(Gln) amidotransferase subunit C